MGSEAQFAKKSIKLLVCDERAGSQVTRERSRAEACRSKLGVAVFRVVDSVSGDILKRSGKPGCELKCGLAGQLGASISFKMAWESSTAEKQGPCSTCSPQG